MGIFKEKDNKGRDRYTVAKRWPDGSSIRRYMPNAATAKVLLAKIEHAIAIGKWEELKAELNGAKEMEWTIASFSDRFIDIRCKPRMRTWVDYERSLRNVSKVYGSIPVKKFDRVHLDEYAKRRSKEVSAASVNREIAAVKSMFSFAYDSRIIAINPLIRYGMLKEQKRTFHVLNSDEVEALIKGQNCPWRELLVCLISETALRISEAMNLRWEDIDFHQGILKVRESKNYKNRQIPLSDKAISCLRSIVRYINNPWVWAKGPNSRHLYPRQGFMRAVNRLKIPIVGFHDLRRYRATKWHEMGLEVRAISRLLGHSDVETTMRYLGIGRDLFERVREAQRREQEGQILVPVSDKQATVNG